MKKPTVVELVLVISSLILVASLGLVLYAWYNTINKADHMVEDLYGDARMAALLGIRDDAQDMLQRLNNSAFNLARVLGSGSPLPPSFFELEQQVSPPLFLTYIAHSPLVTQVAFHNKDGLLLAYSDEGNGTTYFLFSNNTRMASPCYYSQPIDDSTGAPVGSPTASTMLCNTTPHLDYAFAPEGSGYISVGSGFGGDEEPMLLVTAPVEEAAGLSLGVKVQVLVDSMDGRIHGGSLFLVTEDGRVVRGGGAVDVHNLLDGETAHVEYLLALPCMANGASSGMTLLGVGGQPIKLYCASLGVHLAFVLALPYTSLINYVLKFSTITSFLLLSILFGVIVASVLVFQWIRKHQRQETSLYSLLIKQKEATQQAERKSMNKSLAFASASHDVRTSLAGITGLIELCRAEVSPKSELDKNLNQMNACALNLLGILNSVLDISKVEAGKMQLEEAEFDITKVIEESVDMFHVVALKKGLEVIWDPCDDSVFNSLQVKGDSKRLRQILDNLLSNAIKFTFVGHVVVRVWAKRTNSETFTLPHNYSCNLSSVPGLFSCFSHVSDDVFGDSNSPYSIDQDSNFVEFIFEVEDTGMGIPKDKRESIFENYVQVKESTNEGQEGTGLGLGIVQSYVRLMGGEISIIDKESSEKGTCFRFNIFLKSIDTSNERVQIICQEGQACNESSNSCVSYASIANFQCGHHKANQSNSRGMTLCKSLKHEVMHVVLLIQGEETRRILERWLGKSGVKVWVLEHWEHLASTLEKINQKLSSSHYNIFEKSHAVVSGGHTEASTLSNDSRREIEEYMRTKDVSDNLLPPNLLIHELHKKTSINKSVHILLLFDTSYGFSHDTYSIINDYAKKINQFQYKVVWLANSDTPTTELRSLEKKKIPCDLILHKPLHGSRLLAILKLLQEFGESMEVTLETNINGTMQEQDKLVANYNSRKPLDSMKVLVVEDNVVLRRLTSATLCQLGATVELSENGKDALNLVRKSLHEKLATNDKSMEVRCMQSNSKYLPYDIILMDCEMPIMNGFEATKQIRAEEKQYSIHIPIIALTAHAAIEKEADFAEAGMDIHLMKPLKPDMLLDAICKIQKN